MYAFFKELFQYSHHYNQLLIGNLTDHLEKVSPKVIQLQNHIINAHQIWNSRLLQQNSFGVFDIHPLNELKNLDKENCQSSLDIINSKDLSGIVSYRNAKGEAFSNSIRDILFHVINHSTYHRAQIATDNKQNGIDPLVTDYIFYKRQEKGSI
jgi:uncharacterized damage-inducible protein DinB